jgi:hypothetical protein
VSTGGLEARALWHLEIGYHEALFSADDDEGYDDDDDDGFDCTRCGGEGYSQADDPLWDLCDEFGYGRAPAPVGVLTWKPPRRSPVSSSSVPSSSS